MMACMGTPCVFSMWKLPLLLVALIAVLHTQVLAFSPSSHGVRIANSNQHSAVLPLRNRQIRTSQSSAATPARPNRNMLLGLRAAMEDDFTPTELRQDIEEGVAETQEDSPPGPPGMAFRQSDVQVFIDMAKSEEEAGNMTGAIAYRGMAKSLETIVNKPNTATPSSQKKEASKDDPVLENMWPYAHSSTAVSGSTVARSDSNSKSSGARTRNAHTAGEVEAIWKVKVEERKGPMSIGLTTLMVDLDKEFSDPGNVNKAFFISSSGSLYNGDQLIAATGKSIEGGDVVEARLEGDALSFSVNGQEVPGEVRPVTGSLRFSVSMKTQGDGLTLLSEEVREYTADESSSYGTATLSRSSIDDEDSQSLISGIMGTDVTAVSQAAAEPVPGPAQRSVWQMAVEEESGAVYYWNTETQETTWDRPSSFIGVSETAFLEEERRAGKLLKQAEEDSSQLFDNNQDAAKDSHQCVTFDDEGFPAAERLVYVDEQTCIGCTNCATVARSTFFMHQEHGRARAFRQVIEEAVSTCPVDCIWYVSWDDLVALEQERREQVVNPFARLMGGSFIESTQSQGMYGRKSGGKSKASIMNSGAMRCNNCPGRGCKLCPLYGVGENPEFLKRKQARERKRKMKKKGQAMEAAGAGPKLKLSDDGFMNEDGVLDSINTWSEETFSDSDLTVTSSLSEEDTSP